jgi:hypothetical protein
VHQHRVQRLRPVQPPAPEDLVALDGEVGVRRQPPDLAEKRAVRVAPQGADGHVLRRFRGLGSCKSGPKHDASRRVTLTRRCAERGGGFRETFGAVLVHRRHSKLVPPSRFHQILQSVPRSVGACARCPLAQVLFYEVATGVVALFYHVDHATTGWLLVGTPLDQNGALFHGFCHPHVTGYFWDPYKATDLLVTEQNQNNTTCQIRLSNKKSPQLVIFVCLVDVKNQK